MTRVRLILLSVAVAAALIAAGSASAAPAAGWSSVQTLGMGRGVGLSPSSGVNLDANPSGTIGLAFQTGENAVQIARRPAGGTFSTPQTLRIGAADPPTGRLRWAPYASLVGFGLPGRSAALVVLNPDGSSVAQVQARPGAQLSVPQLLIAAPEHNAQPGTVSVLSTSRGEVIADVRPTSGHEAELVRTLATNATRFSTPTLLGHISCGDFTGDPFAVDAAGTAFLAARSTCAQHNMLRLFRRPPRGRVRRIAARPCPVSCEYSVGAGGDGGVAVSAVQARGNRGWVRLAVGRRGRLGRLRTFARVGYVNRTEPTQPSVAHNGDVTFSWTTCRLLDTAPCTVSAVHGGLDGHLGPARRLLRDAHTGDTVQTVEGPDDVLAAVCHNNVSENHCTLKVWFTRPGGRFSAGQTILRGFSLSEPKAPIIHSDEAGDQLIALSGDNGSIHAVVRTAGSERFQTHTLASAGANPGHSLVAVVTSRREAAVAWRDTDRDVEAASYGFGSGSGR